MASLGIRARRRTSRGWRDRPAGYGRVSRTLHWMMAGLFAWQFTSALCNRFAPETTLRDFFWSMHFNFGIILWCLVFVRGAWGLANLSRRPSYKGPRPQRRAAGIVHLALYGLMVTIPTLSLLRAYGGLRGMRFFGQQIFEPREEAIQPLVALGDALHGELGYTLLALVAGHVAMALWHGMVRRDGILQRMTRGDERAASAF